MYHYTSYSALVTTCMRASSTSIKQAALVGFFAWLLYQQYLLHSRLRYISLEKGYSCSDVVQAISNEFLLDSNGFWSTSVNFDPRKVHLLDCSRRKHAPEARRFNLVQR